jgi:hypothetical protein
LPVSQHCVGADGIKFIDENSSGRTQMTANTSLEERLVAVEVAIAELQKQVATLQATHWLQQITGSFKNDDPKLAELPYHTELDFLGFYEDVALMVNSGLLKKPVAHYMFAYYAIRCWENNNFWGNLNRESPYWALFRDFVKQMEKVENSLMRKPHSIKQYKL